MEAPAKDCEITGREPAHQKAAMGLLFTNLFIIGVPQEPGGEHRREGEGNEERDHNGEGHCHAIAGKESARAAFHERERQKNDDQRERRGHHRQRDFARRITGSFGPAPTFFFHRTMDIFQHDDGIIDHDADGEDHAQHREIVERIIHRTH